MSTTIRDDNWEYSLQLKASWQIDELRFNAAMGMSDNFTEKRMNTDDVFSFEVNKDKLRFLCSFEHFQFPWTRERMCCAAC